MTRITIAPVPHTAESLSSYGAVTVLVNKTRLVTVNNPSIAHFPTKGGITVRSRTDKTVKSTSTYARIVTYYDKAGHLVNLTPARAATAPRYDADAERQFADAVARLDSLRPGWETMVDLDTLAMMDGRNCILGQVFAAEGRQGYAENGYNWAYDQGIVAGSPRPFVSMRERWVSIITSRRG